MDGYYTGHETEWGAGRPNTDMMDPHCSEVGAVVAVANDEVALLNGRL